jgi:hypothetical protein
VTVGVYVGLAATVTMQGTGASQQGSARWSAHPETRVLWAVGITGRATAVSKGALGNVLGTTDFDHRGGGDPTQAARRGPGHVAPSHAHRSR